MAEKMSLQRAIDHLHVVVTSSHLPGWKENREAWEVVRAHLTQPAQAVDVGAIQSVIARLHETSRIELRVWSAFAREQADKLTRAIGNARADD